MKTRRSLLPTKGSRLFTATTLGFMAAALPMAGLATLGVAAPAAAVAGTCTGTIAVTNTDTGESLGRITYNAYAQLTTNQADWLQVTPDAETLSGGIGDLLVDDSTALGAVVGGVSQAPLAEMTPGTTDNVYIQTGPTGVSTSGNPGYSSELWSLNANGELVVKWTQPNGDVLPMAGYYDVSYAGAAADFGAFVSEYGGGGITPITYSFVPNSGQGDACPPSISAEVTSDLPANAAGWYRTPATVTYTCTGGTAPTLCPAPYTRDNTKTGFAVARKTTDADGRTARVLTPLQIDTTAPQLRYTSTGTGPFARNAQPITCTATDKRSGLDGNCTVTYGDIVANAKGRDTRRWTATATDVASNTTTISGAFRVTAP